jgi:hypothetical protein
MSLERLLQVTHHSSLAQACFADTLSVYSARWATGLFSELTGRGIYMNEAGQWSLGTKRYF